jgi:hypothetical protein
MLAQVSEDPKMPTLIKIVEVKARPQNRLSLVFSDGANGVHDLGRLFANSGPMIEPLRDPKMFERVFPEHGAVTWPNGFDLSPWGLRRRMEEAGELAAATAAE